MTALARRAVACAAFRWLPGMLTLPHTPEWHGERIGALVWSNDDYTHSHTRDARTIPADAVIHGAWLVGNIDTAVTPFSELPSPDFDDDPTKGALLGLVREAWGQVATTCLLFDGGWRVYGDDGPDDVPRTLGEGATEAEALVAALEAAP